MDKKHVIMIHVSPHEIDQYQTFIHNLRNSLDYVPKKALEELIFIPYLNLSSSLYNWNKSWVEPNFFTNKFNKLNKIIESKIKVSSDIVTHSDPNDKILGALSYKAKYIKQYRDKAKSFIWFDCDLWFPPTLLVTLVTAYQNVRDTARMAYDDDKFIITPEIVKLWDNTWDVLVNENFLMRAPSHEAYYNFDPYTIFTIDDRIPELQENNENTKFASGWGNLLSSNIFDEISLDGLGHYGVDDTFIMFAMDKLKQQGKNYKQFILRNVVVTENNLHKEDFYGNLIAKQEGCKLKEDFRRESEINMINKLNEL
jgi:hypothetical protein